MDREKLKAEYDAAMKETGDREFWKPKDSLNLIRILPPKDVKQLFYVKTGAHFGLLGSKMELCPKETYGKDCPVCEFVQQLYGEKTQAAAKLIAALKVRKRYLMNIIALDIDQVKPLYFLSGITVWKDLCGFIMDDDYGDITHAKTGRNVVIEKSGSKLQTEYAVRVKPNPTPLPDVSILNEMKDIREILKEKIKSYDGLAALLISPEDGDDGEEPDLSVIMDKYLTRAQQSGAEELPASTERAVRKQVPTPPPADVADEVPVAPKKPVKASEPEPEPAAESNTAGDQVKRKISSLFGKKPKV